MRFIAISNYLRVLIFAILLSFAEIAEINTRENMSGNTNGPEEFGHDLYSNFFVTSNSVETCRESSYPAKPKGCKRS